MIDVGIEEVKRHKSLRFNPWNLSNPKEFIAESKVIKGEDNISLLNIKRDLYS